MHPLWWPFQWPLRCGGTIPRASPDGEGPGLSYKPLNTAIGRTLAPIASIGHHNAGIWVGFWGRGVGDGAILYGGFYYYMGVWHIKMKTRTWQRWWNTYMGVLGC
jgi:hypothetical protein